MIHFLTIGTVLGLSAGFAPGPLLTLVLSETLQHGVRSGIKVAIAPLITDIPIILLTLFVLSRLSNFHDILGIISIAGGLFILSMGYKNLSTRGVELSGGDIQAKSLAKGTVTNALSPHPYLFWFSVGAPIMNKALALNTAAFLAFIMSFYVFLVGSKIGTAIVIGKSRSFLTGKVYIYTMRSLGMVLCVLALVLLRDGLQLLEII